MVLLDLHMYKISTTGAASPWDSVAPSPVPIRASGSSLKSSNSRYGSRPQIPSSVEVSQQSEVVAFLNKFLVWPSKKFLNSRYFGFSYFFLLSGSRT